MSYGQELTIRWLTMFFGPPQYIDYRPDWMNGTELDAYWPYLKIAIEFQGDQHYIPIYGEDNLRQQKRRDGPKRKLCLAQGVSLIRIDAVDLNAPRLKRLIRNIMRRNKRKSPKFLHDKEIYNVLREESQRYRELLREKYNSPSACRKGGYKRKEIVKNAKSPQHQL